MEPARDAAEVRVHCMTCCSQGYPPLFFQDVVHLVNNSQCRVGSCFLQQFGFRRIYLQVFVPVDNSTGISSFGDFFSGVIFHPRQPGMAAQMVERPSAKKDQNSSFCRLFLVPGCFFNILLQLRHLLSYLFN